MPRTIYINHGDDDFALMDASGLVSTLANMYGRVGNPAGPRDHDVEYLPEAAMELASPVLDYEKAAREDGWAEVAADPNPGDTLRGEKGPCLYHANLDRVWDAGDWLGACAETGIDPHEREVFEHWAVDLKLGGILRSRGERVDMDFAGLVVWARTSDAPIEECPVLAGLTG